MKKYTWWTGLAAILIVTGCKPSREAYRRDFVKGCVNRYAKDSTVASVEGRKAVEAYCNCMGDKLNAKMDANQWRTFNKSGDTTLSEFRQDLQPCIEDFQKKLLTLPPYSAGK
ncbi:hypothetical protein [Taibaiella koreensis]|uniref:hypothetical protein n=1 Tax=Taibaiella koreensis TaxID=1268548 RepID=UPI000E59D762|nr:hypothetical protein [Taibaiella koreensis]